MCVLSVVCPKNHLSPNLLPNCIQRFSQKDNEIFAFRHWVEKVTISQLVAENFLYNKLINEVFCLIKSHLATCCQLSTNRSGARVRQNIPACCCDSSHSSAWSGSSCIDYYCENSGYNWIGYNAAVQKRFCSL